MYKLWVDGSCSGRKGGWAIVGSFGDIPVEVHGFEDDTTNNRMELTAFIEALKLVGGDAATIMLDSDYVKNGTETWMNGWKRRNWKTKDGGQVLNKDLWLIIDSLYDDKRHQLRHVASDDNLAHVNSVDARNGKAEKLESVFTTNIRVRENLTKIADMDLVYKLLQGHHYKVEKRGSVLHYHDGGDLVATLEVI